MYQIMFSFLSCAEPYKEVECTDFLWMTESEMSIGRWMEIYQGVAESFLLQLPNNQAFQLGVNTLNLVSLVYGSL